MKKVLSQKYDAFRTKYTLKPQLCQNMVNFTSLTKSPQFRFGEMTPGRAEE